MHTGSIGFGVVGNTQELGGVGAPPILGYFQPPQNQLSQYALAPSWKKLLQIRLVSYWFPQSFALYKESQLIPSQYLLPWDHSFFMCISLCIFLPSASDAIIKSSPIKYRGSAIALYSQCFGISALTVPWMAGKLIDIYGTALQLWLIVSLICILLVPISKNIK